MRALDTAINAVKGFVGKAADKLDPVTEQYAGLFKTGLRTPIMHHPEKLLEWFDRSIPSSRWRVRSQARHGGRRVQQTERLC